jgi:hypothetical protein
LTPAARPGKVRRIMSGTDTSEIPGTPLRKHRHDLGHEDHGPKLAAGTTRAIQTLLGLWVALTLALVVYALIDGMRARSAVPAAPTSTSSSSAPPAASSGAAR